MKNHKEYRICKTCVMDTTDPTIIFDENGICDYCHNYKNIILPNWHPNEKGRAEIMKVVDKIKKEGANRDYDCMIGISGGLDSSYLAHIAVKEFGLRPLFFHVDAGWNSDVSTQIGRAHV